MMNKALITGQDISILELAELIKQICGYTGLIQLDATKPDGTTRKLMDVTKLSRLGWKASITLPEGVAKVFEDVKNIHWD